MGRSSPFLVTRIVLRGHSNIGERLPILLDRQSRKPVTAVMEWALSVRRNKPVSTNTLERELRHLGHFEAWLKLNGLSVRDPIAFVDAFTPNRIEASLRPWLGKDMSDQKVKKISINPSGIRDRIQVIAAYVDWVLQNAERSLSVRTQAAQILALRATRESVARSLSDILPTQNEGSKADGLSSSEVTRLLAIINPQNPHNPWARGNSDEADAIRKRNQVIVLLMLAFGPRRGDVLKLQTGDVKTHGSEPTLWVVRRPDDPKDSRKFEPNAKTQERMLPLDAYLARILDDYISDYRKLVPNYKKSPYLMLSSSTGRPLSSRAVNDIFELLKFEFPGIRPHICRHTHNDRLRAYCRLHGVDNKDAVSHAMYLNGWLGDNTGIYTQREARMSAHMISRSVQRDLFTPIEHVPF